MALVEIVGFWRADYLRRKVAKIRRAGLRNLIVVVSTALNVTAEELRDLPGAYVWFHTAINPQEVLEQVEQVAIHEQGCPSRPDRTRV